MHGPILPRWAILALLPVIAVKEAGSAIKRGVKKIFQKKEKKRHEKDNDSDTHLGI